MEGVDRWTDLAGKAMAVRPGYYANDALEVGNLARLRSTGQVLVAGQAGRQPLCRAACRCWLLGGAVVPLSACRAGAALQTRPAALLACRPRALSSWLCQMKRVRLCVCACAGWGCTWLGVGGNDNKLVHVSATVCAQVAATASKPAQHLFLAPCVPPSLLYRSGGGGHCGWAGGRLCGRCHSQELWRRQAGAGGGVGIGSALALRCVCRCSTGCQHANIMGTPESVLLSFPFARPGDPIPPRPSPPRPSHPPSPAAIAVRKDDLTLAQFLNGAMRELIAGGGASPLLKLEAEVGWEHWLAGCGKWLGLHTRRLGSIRHRGSR